MSYELQPIVRRIGPYGADMRMLHRDCILTPNYSLHKGEPPARIGAATGRNKTEAKPALPEEERVEPLKVDAWEPGSPKLPIGGC